MGQSRFQYALKLVACIVAIVAKSLAGHFNNALCELLVHRRVNARC